MKKRIIASILTVIMLMTMLQTAALAADGEGTEAVASTTPQAAIYLDQQHGADSNDGLTKESAATIQMTFTLPVFTRSQEQKFGILVERQFIAMASVVI